MVELKKKKATKIFQEGSNTVIRFYLTDIVSFNSNEIILNSGGWLTNTTKDRMNQVARDYNLYFRVFQKNNKWFVLYKGSVIPFENNMKLKR